MLQQHSIRDESWQPDATFLEDIADEVHGLVFPPAPPANKERFKAQIEAAIEYQRRHDEARAELDRREREHEEKVKQDPRLRDHQAGPPEDKWVWDKEFVVEWAAGVQRRAVRVGRRAPRVRRGRVCVGGRAPRFEEGAWVPPDFPTESRLPPEPVPCHGSLAGQDTPEDMRREVRLTGKYVIVAIVHDDADAATDTIRPRLLADYDLPPSFRLLLERGPHSGKKPKVDCFDRATIRRALKAVSGDLTAGTTEAREVPKPTIPKRYRLAHESHEWACKELPALVAKGCYSEDLYKYVKENWQGYGDPGPPCPPIGTWARYVREYVRLTAGPKNTPRQDRRGRSTVRQGEL
jgi:hypothetical protein